MPNIASERSVRWRTLIAGDPAFILSHWRAVWIEHVGTCTYTLNNSIDPIMTRVDTQKEYNFGSPDQKNLNDNLIITCTAGSIIIHYLQNI